MSPDKTVRVGVVGSAIVAICCATPILVIAFGAVGLSAWLAWLDHVLFPALALFLAIAAYGLWRRQRAVACDAPETQSGKTQPNNERA